MRGACMSARYRDRQRALARRCVSAISRVQRLLPGVTQKMLRDDAAYVAAAIDSATTTRCAITCTAPLRLWRRGTYALYDGT